MKISIPIAVARSQSGNGFHAWFFFNIMAKGIIDIVNELDYYWIMYLYK